ncbi:MAG: sulfotransferase family 2 domain-containing protein [Candidatus Reddybacter sp.]
MKLPKLKLFRSTQSDQKKPFIFIHIQKTAGKSIKQALGLKGGADHRAAKIMRDETDESIWNGSFKFSFVRNPWDRIVSAYYYRLQGGNGSNNDLIRAKKYPDTFELFCEQIAYFQSLENESMFVPQKDWITDNHSNQIIDFIGRIENIQNDFNIICNRLGRQQVQLPHINQSLHESYRDVYNANTRKLIALAYQEDIEYFKYTF